MSSSFFFEIDKIVKNFCPEERVGNQQWQGAFVGTIRYYDAPFFGVFYDDGDFEDMDLEELATCTSREPDAVASIIAKEAIAFVTGSAPVNKDTALKTDVVGYALAPVTLSETEFDAVQRRKKHNSTSPNSFAAECLLKEAMKRMAELKEAMAQSLSEGKHCIDCTFCHPVFGIEAILDSRSQDGDAEVLVKWAKVEEGDSWELRSDLVLFSDELPAPPPKCTANLQNIFGQEQNLSSAVSIPVNQHLKQSSIGDYIFELVRMTPSSMLPAKAPPIDGFLVRLYFTRRPNESLGLNVGMDGELDTFLSFYVASVLPASCAQASGALQGDILISLGGTLTRDMQVCVAQIFACLFFVFTLKDFHHFLFFHLQDLHALIKIVKALPLRFQMLVVRKFTPVATPVTVGTSFRKFFSGHGVFQGKVINIDQPNAANSQTEIFKIAYEDGDSEELTRPELEELLAISPDLVSFEVPRSTTPVRPPVSTLGCPPIPPTTTLPSAMAVNK